MRFYKNYEEYEKDFPFDIKKPTVAILFYGHKYPVDTSSCVGEIKKELRNLQMSFLLQFQEHLQRMKRRLKM